MERIPARAANNASIANMTIRIVTPALIFINFKIILPLIVDFEILKNFQFSEAFYG